MLLDWIIAVCMLSVHILMKVPTSVSVLVCVWPYHAVSSLKIWVAWRKQLLMMYVHGPKKVVQFFWLCQWKHAIWVAWILSNSSRSSWRHTFSTSTQSPLNQWTKVYFSSLNCSVPYFCRYYTFSHTFSWPSAHLCCPELFCSHAGGNTTC